MDNKQYNRAIRHFLSVPFIWAVLVPLIFLDIVTEIYHRICFPLFGLKYVCRRDYIRIDRYKLPYLSLIDKFNCMYCEYANGLMAYTSRIGADTEKYWCGIKHEQTKNFHEPLHHKDFIKYGDKASYEKLCKLNKKNK